MSGTQLTERPHEYVSNDRSTDLPIASQDLLQGQRQVWIDHGGTLYCLKATSNGRLYLTK
ncbi:hemin uptake protein HemP [Bremerella cremea]|uniref:Hemin uptake protein HemP n=1 Tax=Blastopirellula marina TaxID=124 RepID=A0A2S8FLQ0_9BACT|nr:hemin uptake protein HemP [Blastopirellula marina]RCS46009.1 hemin uptake protein HemP [Bremerella cremea]